VRKTFGQFQKDKGVGLLRPVSFPSMALLDTTTGDGREIASSGAGVRELPRTIFAQPAQEGGHTGSVPVGTLQEVTFEEDGNVTGRGWLADIPIVRDHFVPLIASKTLFHNSVDLAEVTYEYVWKSDDPADGIDYWTIEKILFTKSNIAATTIVGVPAFADARIALDEVTAALVAGDGELEWDLDPDHFTYRIEGRDEIMASLGALDLTVAWDDFHMPEPNQPTGWTVTGDGRVFGHLAEWGKCHEGREDVCILAPRPMSYATFNKFNVLTDKGMVQTGPVFFLGGHPSKPLDPAHVDQAYGGIENAWSDIRVTDGRFGPWACGRVRPGVTEEAVYAARASGVSGHWKRGDLQAVVSVNAPGYLIPGTEIRADRGGASFDDEGVLDLVASLRLPAVDPDKMRATVAEQIEKALSTSFVTTTGAPISASVTVTPIFTTTSDEAVKEPTAVATIADEAVKVLELDLLLAELDDEDES
jgi:hypothetical protein